ncbi:hypothetical protein PV327_000151 [Microctonus hyperodae]|uniref:Peptidase M12B domain-containing protein n=1 Tax=Microctonus hyperodae TaxID=165561 RepID=A0AA39L1V4_MICHY|nr:hypothetical protein PV327_000151 [Microctonus hyperodae]
MERYFTANICIGMLLFSIVASVTSRGIHKDMTRAELLQTFDVTENLPEYEIVPIYYSHVNKRAINGRVSLRLKSFGKEISLWLKPTEGVLFSDETSVFTFARTPKGPQYTKHENMTRSLHAFLYTDFRTYTTLAVSRRSKYGKRMVGMIRSENLIIRPVPNRFYTSMRYGRSINEIPESERNDYHYHIVYKSAINNKLEQFKSSTRMKRGIQDTVYPEILVIVDESLYNIFERNILSAVMYLMAFWNGVDMMYRSLENPKFRLNIPAIILVEDKDLLSYISSNQIESNGLHYNKAFDDYSKWLYKNLPSSIDKNSYDVAVTMTRLDFCDVTNNLKQCSKKETLGIASIFGACCIDDNLNMINKTMMIHDDGGFGVCDNDDDYEKNCSSKIGDIIRPKITITNNSVDQSNCSLTAFEIFLKDEGKCLYNKPKHSGNLPRLLPGKMWDADQQCKYQEGTEAFSVDEDICQLLFCYNRDYSLMPGAVGAALDGTPCGYEKMCLHNQCILESLFVTES